MRILLFLAVILVLAAGALWSGVYNVSALEPHWGLTLKILAFARDMSIAAHSRGVQVPPLDDPKLSARGVSEYREMCRICHGAPGVAADVIAQGLYPTPANLQSGELQKEWKDNQLFWIVENGIKMTGMPSFGISHNRDELLGIVAFLRRLPGMTPEEYQTLSGGSGEVAKTESGDQG